MLRFGLPPAIKWRGGEGQRHRLRGHKEKHHRPPEGKMDRRAAKGNVLPQHDGIEDHEVYPIQATVW